jgi:hypothetical protein
MADVESPGSGPTQETAEASACGIVNALCKLKYGETSFADIQSAKLKGPLNSFSAGVENPITWYSGLWTFDCTPPDNPGDESPEPEPPPSFWRKVPEVAGVVVVAAKLARDVVKGMETGDASGIEEDVEEAKHLIGR